jgi:DNA-binding protein H-NS
MARDSRSSAADVIPLLEGLTVTDLDEVIAAAERQRETSRESGKRELVEEFRAKAAAMGLSLEELVGGAARTGRTPGRARSARKGAPGATPAAAPAARYRNPETGETWSGRGRAPNWLKRAEEQGRGRGDFAVADRSG